MIATDPEAGDSFDIDVERQRFRQDAEKDRRFNRHTYDNDANIDQRTRFIFNLVSRTLWGRRSLSRDEKARELRNLSSIVRLEIVYPLLNSHVELSNSQDGFDLWHQEMVDTLKAKCPIRWDKGPVLKVGLAQLLINLHCKSMWAWERIPDRDARYFHASITQVTLRHLLDRNPTGWTRWDSYDGYMQCQWEIRQMADKRETYSLALECWNWNKQNLD